MTGFAEFWAVAKGCRGRLNSGGPHESERIWKKLMKEGIDPDIIIAGWLGYQQAMLDTDTDLKHRLMATTFLNKRLFTEHLDEDAAREHLAGYPPKLRVVK